MFTLLDETIVEKLKNTLDDGFDLEKAFKVQNSYVLFLTENTPHEETLTILRLDSTYSELEKIELYAAYMPGIFSVTDVSENSIAFTFWSKQPMRLCFMACKQYRWQFKGVSNVSYLGGFFKSRQLIVKV